MPTPTLVTGLRWRDRQGAALLRAARAALGSTVVAVAADVGLSRITIERAEAGTMSPRSWSVLVAYHAARGIDVARDPVPTLTIHTW